MFTSSLSHNRQNDGDEEQQNAAVEINISIYHNLHQSCCYWEKDNAVVLKVSLFVLLHLQVIIDECAMCKEPECLIPIVALNPEQVVLIGDHKQLQPVILDKGARQCGLVRSLFERYAEKRENNDLIVMLNEQYRMVNYHCCYFNVHPALICYSLISCPNLLNPEANSA